MVSTGDSGVAAVPAGAAAPSGPRPRAVILVGSPANPYSRALRLGRTLQATGYDTEIAATHEPGLPLEETDGPLRIRRYPASGVFARAYRAVRASTAPGAGSAAARARKPSLPARILRSLRNGPVAWVFFPHTVRGWWHTLARELAPADLYHACGTLPIAAALAARERDRKAGRSSVVIFDVIDITMESNNVLAIPKPVLWWLARRERRWARAADGITAVNDAFADWAQAHWDLPVRPTVVPNYPEPQPEPTGPVPDLVRQATGLPASTRILLFWGRLGPYVGLDQAAEAMLAIPDTALVLLGFGRGWDASLARDADPRYAGRHFTLPAVHPDELPAWVASADVAMNALPPISFSQRYTFLNKFFEAMTGGLPMVLGPELSTMEAVLVKEDLGRVAASMDPADIAAAVRDILDRSPEDMGAWRARIRATARERYAWPIAAAAYQDLVRRLRPG
jgi:glycosyltransferase involved in cell wall biosynthesis